VADFLTLGGRSTANEKNFTPFLEKFHSKEKKKISHSYSNIFALFR